MAAPQAAYEELLARWREVHVLDSCGGLLAWDQETFMPTGGGPHRAEQLALLAGLKHARQTDPVIGRLLSEAERGDVVADPDSAAAANVREIRRLFERSSRVPVSLQQELARTSSRAREAWKEARAASRFGTFRPWLERLLDLKRREAEAVGTGEDSYDALLDEYEPGATARQLTELFRPLRAAAVGLVRRIRDSGRTPDVGILRRSYPPQRQEAFARRALAAIGFDLDRGRLDTTAHPFCSQIGPGDVRLTTRYSPHDLALAFFGVLHEGGHGLYDQGLRPDAYGTPVGMPCSTGVHESQSLLWENHVGRSRGFWRHFYGAAREAFPEALGGVARDAFYAAINRVEPSLIRIEADEVTYDLHVFLRFDLERDLLSGALAPADLPAAWNERMHRDLGLRPPDDARGCLQDIHWSLGAIGYFPTYTLGHVYAAQLFHQAGRELGDLDAAFARGEFRPLREWLQERVHRDGARRPPAALVERITGKPPGPEDRIAHLERRYGELYGLSPGSAADEGGAPVS
ncbi:MAG: carboxypeptidase M32 [Planctomycetota bacterium]